VDPAGSALLQVSIANCGQGAYTVLQQIVAEVLGVPSGQVRVDVADTDSELFDSGVGGSKTTNSAGHAAEGAALGLLALLTDAAAAQWACAPDEVQHRNGAFIGPREQILTLAEAAALASSSDGQLSYTEVYEPSEERTVTSFCAQVAEVQVDAETGHVKVQRLVTVHDVGIVLNPLGHQGQINGGAIQGMGFALCEETPVIDGVVSTLDMTGWKMPNIADIPQLETILLEDEAGPVPYHGKAIGELPNVPIAAAIANAVQDAVGVSVADLPVTAEKVYAAVRASRA